MVNQNNKIKESFMTRLFKSVISALVMFSLVAVLPAETSVVSSKVEFTVEQDNDVLASAEVKKKKKKGKKFSEKGKKKKKSGIFKKLFGGN